MDLKIELDLRSHIPIHTQIVEQIRAALVSGELKAGQRLPPARQLAEELGVNFSTVARAYRQLDTEGLLSAQHGRGTFTLGSGQVQAKQTRGERLSELSLAYLSGARRLGFSDQEVMEALKQALEERRE